LPPRRYPVAYYISVVLRYHSGRCIDAPASEKESRVKKTRIKKMSLHRETLRELDAVALEGGQLKKLAGGAWPVTTVRPYPCQPTCLCV
jgi:hypothetical protein